MLDWSHFKLLFFVEYFFQENVGLVQSGPPADAVMSRSMPTYRSDLHLNRLKEENLKFTDSDDLKKGSRSCKILLLFSEDGVQASDLAISLADQVTYEVSLTYRTVSKFTLANCRRHKKLFLMPIQSKDKIVLGKHLPLRLKLIICITIMPSSNLESDF